MFAPMLLGYALGAIGVYAALYRFAPVSADETATTHAPKTEVITLFDEETVRRAA